MAISDTRRHLEAQTPFVWLRKQYAESTGRTVFFCGAGASLSAGLPDWSSFVDLLDAEVVSYEKTLGVHEDNEANRRELQRIAAYKERRAQERDPWRVVQLIYDALPSARFEKRVREVLARRVPFPPFYKKVWEFNLKGILTVNLDGFVRASYADLRTGVPENWSVGQSVARNRSILRSPNPFIVELHGSIDDSTSWILKEGDLQSLLQDGGYIQFLRNIFSDHTVIFYGLSVNDVAISGQIRYLKDVRFSAGDHYLIRRGVLPPHEQSIERDLGVEVITLPDNISWEEGFDDFVEILKNFKTFDGEFEPVLDHTKRSENTYDPETLKLLDPNEIRRYLGEATGNFFDESGFSYEKYKKFCADYDIPILMASRVRLDNSNNQWLDYTLHAQIGSGNFGTVYRGVDKTGESAAIKIAHEKVRDSDAMLNNFRRGVNSMKILTASGISGVVPIIVRLNFRLRLL